MLLADLSATSLQSGLLGVLISESSKQPGNSKLTQISKAEGVDDLLALNPERIKDKTLPLTPSKKRAIFGRRTPL